MIIFRVQSIKIILLYQLSIIITSTTEEKNKDIMWKFFFHNQTIYVFNIADMQIW